MTYCFLRKLYSFLKKLSIISFYHSALYCSFSLLSLLQSLSIAFHSFSFLSFYSSLYPFFLSIFNWPILHYLFFIWSLFYHPFFLTFHTLFHHFSSSYTTSLLCAVSCSWNTSCMSLFHYILLSPVSVLFHTTVFLVVVVDNRFTADRCTALR